MAKKGGAQQLQAEINSDEELYKFLEKPGLLVMDVYSEWCGPCVAMIGSLKKIKLEIGGDTLHLAICKSDTIDALERFRNKSEPTWLFATKGKLVNLMFGTDVPKLMQLIANELALVNNTKRTFYLITELQPEERARRDVIENALAEARRLEAEEAERQKLERLNFATNEIMTNLPDVGVTIFGPHVVRETYKKLMEVAETQKISCKDRRTAPIVPEMFDIINFACENPLEPEVIAEMCNKDLLICYWKVSDQDKRELQDIFLSYAHDLTHQREVISDFGEVEEILPPILTPLEIKISNKTESLTPKAEVFVPEPLVEEIVEEPAAEEGDEGAEGGEAATLIETMPSVASFDGQIISVPGIWVPADRRTHATLIYVFFRAQTFTFLEPDPIPDPPHIIMAFDAYKKKDIIEVMVKHKENILLYGFFTTDNPNTATLIANTVASYDAKSHQTTDKLVLKVAKKTSHTMLAFATYAPSYVSANTVSGAEEALMFFPEGYVNEEIAEVEAEMNKKKKKGKSK